MTIDYRHPSRPAPAPVSLYKPRHRRAVPVDFQPTADCTSPSTPWCTERYCPEHAPIAYADAMARHATDSFPLPVDNGCAHAADLVAAGVRGYGAKGLICAECWF